MKQNHINHQNQCPELTSAIKVWKVLEIQILLCLQTLWYLKATIGLCLWMDMMSTPGIFVLLGHHLLYLQVSYLLNLRKIIKTKICVIFLIIIY